jgi:hypothetical protein
MKSETLRGGKAWQAGALPPTRLRLARFEAKTQVPNADPDGAWDGMIVDTDPNTSGTIHNPNLVIEGRSLRSRVSLVRTRRRHYSRWPQVSLAALSRCFGAGEGLEM